MAEQPYEFTAGELRDYIRKEIAGAQPKRGGLTTLLWWFFLLSMAGAFLLLTADHFKMIPQAWIDKALPPAQTTFSTAVQPPAIQQQRPADAPATGEQRYTPFYSAATPAPVLWGELQGSTPEPTATEAPYTTQPNLGPSSPESNPGFSCGVEPGMDDPNATCEEATPVEVEAEPNVYSVEDRVFQPTVLPTSSTTDNPGYDSSIEPGSEPTPVR